jgi:hypothetical protein
MRGAGTRTVGVERLDGSPLVTIRSALRLQRLQLASLLPQRLEIGVIPYDRRGATAEEIAAHLGEQSK